MAALRVEWHPRSARLRGTPSAKITGVSPLASHLFVLALLAGAASQPTPQAKRYVEITDAEMNAVERAGREYVTVLAKAVRAAPGVDEPARAALAGLLDGHERRENDGSTLASSELAGAFETWTSATRRLGPQLRTDALLLADRVLEIVSRRAAIGPDPPYTTRVRLAGAEFQYEPLGGGYVYGHTFLRQARGLAPPGPARDRVLLREMEIGFDYRGQCSGGDDVTAKVIAAGEALLRRSKDPRVRASAHLVIADAHATIVALARGDAADYFDTSAYGRREKNARREAIAHYRAGLAIDPNPPDAELVRRDLQRLLDGAAPGLAGGAARLRIFYCVYD